jgi:DNA end-binding protein Ku
MAPRPYWKGYLKLSLVSCAVALYPATSRSERISFNWLNRDTGNRLKQLMVDSETGEPVEKEERVRAYQLSKNDYLPIEEEELEAVEIESTHTIEIETFVPRAEIDPVYLEGSYYLAPGDKVAEEAFSVIRDAMAAKNVVGIGRVVLTRRERLVALEPRGKGILATLLHYNYEVRQDEAYFEDIPQIEVPDEMLGLAEHIIATKSGHFDVGRFEDRYENALTELIRAKQAGRPAELPQPERPHNVVNLMDALRKSVAAEQRERGGKAEAAPAQKEEAASSRPKRTARESAKAPAAEPAARRTARRPAKAEGESAPPRKKKAG